jgi:hypothetical protein
MRFLCILLAFLHYFNSTQSFQCGIPSLKKQQAKSVECSFLQKNSFSGHLGFQTSLGDAKTETALSPQAAADTAVRYNALRGVLALSFEHAVKTGSRLRDSSTTASATTSSATTTASSSTSTASSSASSSASSKASSESTIPGSHSWKDGVLRRYTSHEYLMPFSLARSVPACACLLWNNRLHRAKLSHLHLSTLYPIL